MESAPNGALYLRRSLRVAASGGAAEATGERAGERSAAERRFAGQYKKNQRIYLRLSCRKRSHDLTG